MEFRISQTFSNSLARLTADEQKQVKATVYDLQENPANPGHQLHKLDKVRDKNFWSVRAGRDIRLIVHRTADNLLLCFVGHHDDAYQWAERRKIETHPTTGAAQLVEIRERYEDVVVPRYIEAVVPAPPKPPLFAGVSDATLMGYGVPTEWLEEVRKATEDTLLYLTDHLPNEAAEAMLDLAFGKMPVPAVPTATTTDPFAHPDAQRRFRVIASAEELERALEYPWEQWTVFLHPSQRDAVERSYNGPVRISGSAGTGKTIVALHRAVHLARLNQNARVLLTTFSEPLANMLRTKLLRLIGNEPRIGERIDVFALDTIAVRLHELNLGKVKVATAAEIRGLVLDALAKADGLAFKSAFVLDEWENVVDAWQLHTWEEYRDVPRLGRKRRLTEKHRAALWDVSTNIREALRNRGLVTQADVYGALAKHFAAQPLSPFEHIIVDEAQDLSVAQLRFLATLGGTTADRLFFSGDLGQRIFQQPFSWKALGVDIRGRSRTLRVNYRTSHQIRTQADRLLGPEVSDVDGNVEDRSRTVSVFNGPPPVIRSVGSPDEEAKVVAEWIRELQASGVTPNEIGIFVRSEAQIPRAVAAAKACDLPAVVLDDGLQIMAGKASICSMHLAKGLEFRTVVVMACDDDVIPLRQRIEQAGDDVDLEEIYNTERHLLYVACTRARDHLLVTGVDPVSEFLDDLETAPSAESDSR